MELWGWFVHRLCFCFKIYRQDFPTHPKLPKFLLRDYSLLNELKPVLSPHILIKNKSKENKTQHLIHHWVPLGKAQCCQTGKEPCFVFREEVINMLSAR